MTGVFGMHADEKQQPQDPRFSGFMQQQFNLFQQKQQVFIDYLGVPQPLSACLKESAHAAGMFAAMDLLRNAQDRLDENGTFILSEEDTVEIDRLHDSLLDFIFQQIFPNFDERLIDLPADETTALIETAYNDGLEAILNQG